MKLVPLRIFVIIAIFILVAVGGFFFFQKGNIFTKKTPSSNLADILFFTSPVNEFTGIIDKISGNSIWVSGKYTITPPPTPPNNPTNVPGQVITVPPLPPTKKFTYKVNIVAYTVVNRPETPIIYLYKKGTPTPTPTLTIKDMREGQLATVYTTSDLRSLKQNEFDAYAVKLGPLNNIITGKIKNINIREGMIIIKAIPPAKPSPDQAAPSPKEIEYAISVTADTEISHLGTGETTKTAAAAKPPQPAKFQLNELKADIQITVYTEQDVTDTQKVKALRIEPPADFVPAVTLAPTKEATSSAKN